MRRRRPAQLSVNSKGELAVSGQLITGAPSEAVVGLFLLKVSADGTQIIAGPQGLGGLVAVDSQDNIYLAGVPPGSTEPSATPGAYQGKPATFSVAARFSTFPAGATNLWQASLPT